MMQPVLEVTDVSKRFGGVTAVDGVSFKVYEGEILGIIGPNGSGKTTLLDAMRTLLGLDCSGGRNYKTYARHANADSAWLRTTWAMPKSPMQASRSSVSSTLLRWFSAKRGWRVGPCLWVKAVYVWVVDGHSAPGHGKQDR